MVHSIPGRRQTKDREEENVEKIEGNRKEAVRIKGKRQKNLYPMFSRHFFTSTFPLLAHKKQSTLGVTGTEVSRLRPPASHTFSTSWSLLKSTLIRCTPSQGTLDLVWPLVEGVLSQFKVLLLGGLAVSGFSCSSDRREQK